MFGWLHAKGIAPVASPPIRWYATTAVAPQKGDKVDCWAMVESLSGEEWIAWSEQNPELANEFWPLVVRLMRTEGPIGLAAANRIVVHAEQLRSDARAFAESIEQYRSIEKRILDDARRRVLAEEEWLRKQGIDDAAQ